MAIKLNYLYLVASFAVGLCVMMLTVPKPRLIIKFPSPETADTHVYKDSTHTQCFKIAAEPEECPVDGKGTKSQPLTPDIDDTRDGWGLASWGLAPK
jgi:hypothetical protein